MNDTNAVTGNGSAVSAIRNLNGPAKEKDPTAEITIRLDPFLFATFSGAALANDCTVSEIIEKFLATRAADFSNDNFDLEAEGRRQRQHIEEMTKRA